MPPPGVWTNAATGRWHLRDDLIDALRRIKVPNVRWPGGCFADYYHWRDGIGAPERRPTMVNTLWGNVVEDNSFGTHEFLELVRRMGTEAFVVGNMGTGTPREMAEWWEYLNHPGGSSLAEERVANGHPAPYNVRRWGVGNESWGCGGSMGIMRDAGRMIDGLDAHYYTVPITWQRKGSATQFDEREYFVSLQHALHIEDVITRHSAIMDRYDPQKRVALIVGEWGVWTDPEPGSKPGFLYQQNSLRDTLVASTTLDIFNRHADRVRGANIAQMINVLQAMILTRGEQMILTPTYHVFDFYTVHHDAVLLPLALLDAGQYSVGGASMPAVSASASRDGQGVIHVTMTNLDPNQSHTVDAELRGAVATRATGRILTAPAINSYNTFERPDVVHPMAFDGARVSGGTLTVNLPPKSLVVLELR